MKISDLLGDGWEPEEGPVSDVPPPVPTRTVDTAPPPADTVGAPPAPPPAPVTRPTSWGPETPSDPPAPASARAQLADLAAGLAAPVAPIEEPDPDPTVDELVALGPVVDDLLPAVKKRSKSSRGASRSGSRRRER